MRYVLVSVFLVHLALAVGCMPAPPMEQDGKDKGAQAERDFDPLAQDRERPILIEKPRQIPQAANEPQEVQQVAAPGDVSPGLARPGVVQGYRVQIYLSDDLREASRVMAEARDHFQEEVYLEYDAPYYKVRVGDCRTEAEGQQLLEVAHRLGYRDAWLMYTVISVAEESEGQPSAP